MPSAKDYAKRVHADTMNSLDSHLTSLQKALGELKERFTASSTLIEHSLTSLRDPGSRQVEEVVAEAMKEAASAAARDVREEKERTLGFLAHFAHDLRTKETQDEILNLLLDSAARFAPRIALFVTREADFRGWSSRGFPPEIASRIGQWSCAQSDSPFLIQALQANVPTSRGQRSADMKLADLFGAEAQPPWHAFPMRAIRRPVAVLVAAPAAGQECELEPLCILMDLTGLSVENLALKILQEADQAAGPAEVRSGADAPQAALAVEPVAEQGAGTAEAAPSVPEPLPERAVTPEARPEEPAEAPPPVEAATAAPTEEAAAAGPVLSETIEPPQPSGKPEAEVTAPQAAEAEAGKAGKLREVQPQSEEEKLHSDARRFARLLVTEIKLYNEQAVADGRTNKDLYARLRRDVDRSRDMYEKRVSPAIARKTDYFHDEIVKILAGNDPSTLGADYPGPHVVG
jgi:hypothetical protein